MRTLSVPNYIRQLIKEFTHIEVYNKKVRVPYYIHNFKKSRAQLRALSGKGTPEEMLQELKIYSRLRRFDLKDSSAKEIREFMKELGIGIDCSGFVAHILESYSKHHKLGGIHRHFKFDGAKLLKQQLLKLKAIQNLNVNRLTSDSNSVPVLLEQIRPFDMIKSKSTFKGDHIHLITDVHYQQNQVHQIDFVHSSRAFGERSGIQQGSILIEDPTAPLEKQKWIEDHPESKTPSLEGYLKDLENNGIRRAKFIAKIG